MFLQKPTFEASQENSWTLVRECVYASEEFECVITVPSGFSTDLASIPRLFTRILPVNDTHRLPAVVHDYLYFARGHTSRRQLTRKQCDLIFLEAMVAMSVPLWKRAIMYGAVRLAGQLYWSSQ